MPTSCYEMFLVRFICSEEIKIRLCRSFKREYLIVLTVHHQHGNHDSRQKIEYVHNRLSGEGNESRNVECRSFKPVVDGKSIMQMMMLAATEGTKLLVQAVGPDAEVAIAAIRDLVDRKFDEE